MIIRQDIRHQVEAIFPYIGQMNLVAVARAGMRSAGPRKL